jgi:hypothetical protein
LSSQTPKLRQLALGVQLSLLGLQALEGPEGSGCKAAPHSGVIVEVCVVLVLVVVVVVVLVVRRSAKVPLSPTLPTTSRSSVKHRKKLSRIRLLLQ